MNEMQMQVLLIKGALSELPADDQEQVKAAEAEVRAVLAKYPKHGDFAIALIGAEIAAKDD